MVCVRLDGACLMYDTRMYSLQGGLDALYFRIRDAVGAGIYDCESNT